MTIVKVDTRDKDIIAKTLAHMETSVSFYTIENNSKLMQAEIDCDEPSLMWHLGKAVGHAVSIENLLHP